MPLPGAGAPRRAQGRARRGFGSVSCRNPKPALRVEASGEGGTTAPASRFTRHSDKLIERHGERVWRIGLDGGFSCPNRADGGRGGGGCAYCGPRAARAPYSPAERAASIRAQVENAVSFLRRRYEARLFFLYFQAYTSTHAPAAELERIYEEAFAAARGIAELRGLVVSTRPDCLDGGAVELLSRYRDAGLELWVELGLQSANERSLERMRRGHGFPAFAEARGLLVQAGLRTAAHLILGLPGEGRADMLETVRRVADLGIDGVKFHELYLPKGSLWASEYLGGELALMHPARLPALLADCLELLPPSCEVIRLCSDSIPSERAAPRRVADKTRLYLAVEAALASRGSRQGSGLRGPAGL